MTGENNEIIRSDMFYAVHLNPNSAIDIEDIKNFKIDVPEGQGLSGYLKEYACNDELNGEMRTYLVRDNSTDELVGYFSLKAGLISLNETENETVSEDTGEYVTVREFDTLPGVELANFAVNSNYINSYPYQKGIGYVIFKKLIMPIVKTTATYIGIKILYIYALPYNRLISRYERYGFRRLPFSEENDLHRRLKPRYDESCKFMYLLIE